MICSKGAAEIRYYKNLSMDKQCEDMGDGIFSCMSQGIGIYNVYAVCVSPVGSCLFEILDMKNLIKEQNRYKDYGIIAFVTGKKAAAEKVRVMLADWIEEYGNLDGIKDFYNSNCD